MELVMGGWVVIGLTNKDCKIFEPNYTQPQEVACVAP
jgi:hypothetical protein